MPSWADPDYDADKFNIEADKYNLECAEIETNVVKRIYNLISKPTDSDGRSELDIEQSIGLS